MKFSFHLEQELLPLTDAPPDGAMAQRLSRYLRLLEASIQGALTDTFSSVPNDVPPFRLSITVSVIGEQETNESSTSTQQLGLSSRVSHVQSGSSKSPSQAGKEIHQPEQSAKEPAVAPSQTPLSVAGSSYHEFVPRMKYTGPDLFYELDGNCALPGCAMPRTAHQHMRIPDANRVHLDEEA